MRYRIRIGKRQFAEPHYVTKLGFSPNYTSIEVNKNPLSWAKLSTAENHLKELKSIYSTAEIEPYS